MKLADQYSKFLNIRDYNSLPDLSHEIANHHRRSSEGNILSDASNHPVGKQALRNSADGDSPDLRTPGRRRKTLIVSRGAYLPSLTMVGGKELKKKEIQRMTRKTISILIAFAILFEVLNVSIFGGFFAWIEGWSFFEGIYFAVTSLLTIGYGDYILCGNISRSVFIWYAFFGIASSTFLLAMVAESAFDQWSVTVQNIEKRVGRYEKKAELKRKYKVKNKSRDVSEERSSNVGVQNIISDGYIRIEKAKNSAIPFPKILPALSFSTKKLESDSDSESELFLSPSSSSQAQRHRGSSDFDSASIRGNLDLV